MLPEAEATVRGKGEACRTVRVLPPGRWDCAALWAARDLGWVVV